MSRRPNLVMVMLKGFTGAGGMIYIIHDVVQKMLH